MYIVQLSRTAQEDAHKLSARTATINKRIRVNRPKTRKKSVKLWSFFVSALSATMWDVPHVIVKWHLPRHDVARGYKKYLSIFMTSTPSNETAMSNGN